MVPICAEGKVPKLIVCVRFATLNDCETGFAGAQEVSPPWLAVIVQVPPVFKLTVEPETEQTVPVEVLKDTARPELAVAETLNDGSP